MSAKGHADDGFLRPSGAAFVTRGRHSGKSLVESNQAR